MGNYGNILDILENFDSLGSAHPDSIHYTAECWLIQPVDSLDHFIHFQGTQFSNTMLSFRLLSALINLMIFNNINAHTVRS